MTPARAADMPAEVRKNAEYRCDCGSLLARWRDGGLELMCRRCKRRVVVNVPHAPREVQRMS